MLKTVTYLARKYSLPYETPLENDLTCAVMVHSASVSARRQIHIDGSMFNRTEVFPG